MIRSHALSFSSASLQLLSRRARSRRFPAPSASCLRPRFFWGPPTPVCIEPEYGCHPFADLFMPAASPLPPARAPPADPAPSGLFATAFQHYSLSAHTYALLSHSCICTMLVPASQPPPITQFCSLLLSYLSPSWTRSPYPASLSLVPLSSGHTILAPRVSTTLIAGDTFGISGHILLASGSQHINVFSTP
ncbi:hypothetical protein B0H13DRAFT_2310351 [Mycena leptocephala]|nr:hypothetical protein B0H13DRAFT_2310351 [Mycena leptocephala]